MTKLPLFWALGITSLTVASPAWARLGYAQGREFSLGLEIGSSSLFGNGVTGTWRWLDNFQWEAGLGYNSSGGKIGIGQSFTYLFKRSLGMVAGGAVTYSTGHNGEVELDASFTPEGSDRSEPIVATKSFSITPAALVGVQAGMFWDYDRTYRLSGKVCYSAALSGNEVSFGKRITYDKPVELGNEDEFNAEFKREAEKAVKAGGLGFALGAAILF